MSIINVNFAQGALKQTANTDKCPVCLRTVKEYCPVRFWDKEGKNSWVCHGACLERIGKVKKDGN